MTVQYRAAVLRAIGGNVDIETAVSRKLRSDDVLIKIAAAGLCHTDLEVISGSLKASFPIVLGHEAAGTIAEKGPDVQGLEIGDRVVLHWNPSCGDCFYCNRKRPILCEQYLGNARKSFDFGGLPQSFDTNGQAFHHLMYVGAFAEYCVVPARQAVRIPAGLPAEQACLIGCGVMTGVGAALNIAAIQPGDSVLILGCGAVGLAALQGALLADAAEVIACDLNAERLETAKSLGATYCINAAAEDALNQIRIITSGRGADHVLESAGHPAAFRMTTEAVRPGGEIIWLGKVGVDEDVAFRWGALMQEKKIRRSSYGGARPHLDFPKLAEECLRGTLKLDRIVTRTIPLDQINDGFDDLRHSRGIRTVIKLSD
ncbi:S-(hydroxymethyl)glutathione dehydrogenase / alcohol dehydrogenase [Bradyrhizobium sp. Rc2d]|uniref:alcohol dehydrogenase catalytic domain-containing protein n=1 Tax=Bradyrhizobium sp. Rc2d TaxID=1855321 RepID=UPI000881FB15|nr:alcohol dehydrogenase catalytic domain-containing protein [Bradyrhizobium sp. Rc2d]SDJ80158.1 S-(hydroxymethyl)glutathione dehydrogenase / alcohol dehydrogenase [Bradyrhizobium sp. Rc2d]